MVMEELQVQLQGRSFQKIAKKIPLKQWDEAYDFFVEGYKEVLELLKSK
jgi:hypothetical protein